MTAHVKKPITFSFAVVFSIFAVILNLLLLFIIHLWYDFRRGAYAHSTMNFTLRMKRFNVIVKLFVFFLFGLILFDCLRAYRKNFIISLDPIPYYTYNMRTDE